ncbi:syntaxin-8 [Contarinia nasturtii]|uniref:syntaxin-8 n=1 Tax=Contarinia nasturtii TaxID=265458 RepID=UPI0012D3F812|nr:syntaxin-8 [Contarinia nasturtii]
MALVDIDTWITEYAACERLSRDIQSQIVLRNQQPSRLSTEYSKISSGIRFNLKQFTTNLDQLNKTISHSAITTQEAERRQRQVETLQSQYVHLQSQFMNVGNANSDRNQLLGTEKPSYWQSQFDDDDDDDQPLDGFRNQPTSSSGREPSVDDLRKQQTRILDDQNEGLDALSKVISRQKNLALRIGDEFDEQNGIIDNLVSTMDNTNSRMAGTTRNVGEAIQKESTKCYWFLIIILLVVNIIVAIL